VASNCPRLPADRGVIQLTVQHRRQGEHVQGVARDVAQTTLGAWAVGLRNVLNNPFMRVASPVCARRSLGRQLAAWRLRGGLTQGQLARQTGYHRTTIAHAEAGDRASRELAEAADPVLGAGGRLIAARDAISAAVTARSWSATR
jgi:DNA-binding XRE family transcriptional regulator